MHVTVLAIPDCPAAQVLRERLGVAMAGQPPIPVTWHEITDEQQARALGMHRSPTLLIDGRDPFAGDESTPAFACRTYREDQHNPGGSPSVARLREFLRAAGTVPMNRDDQ